MTPAQIEALIARQRRGEISQDELRTALQGVSSEDYAAWARSVERSGQYGGSGAGATGLSALGPMLPEFAPELAYLGATAGVSRLFAGGEGGGKVPPKASDAVVALEQKHRASFDPSLRADIDSAISGGATVEEVSAILTSAGFAASNPLEGLKGRLGEASVDAGGKLDPTSEMISAALENGSGRIDAQGNAYITDPATLDELRFTPGPNGEWFYDPTGGKGSSSGSGDGAAYARIAAEQAEAERNRRFEEEQNRLSRDATASENALTRGATASENEKARQQGRDQFDKTFDRNTFESDREYEYTREKYAQDFAENQFQFDANFGFQRDSTATRFGLEAEQLAAQVAAQNQKYQQEAEDRRRETLRNPSDYLYRAFQSRGETSPYAQVTHGNLLDTIAGNLGQQQAAGNTAVENARAAAGRFAEIPVPTRPLAAQPQPRLQPPSGQSGPTAAQILSLGGVPTAATASDFEDRPTTNAETATFLQGRGDIPQWVLDKAPKAEQGGRFAEDMVVTGDSSDGKPNEELVIDLPNDGGLMVIPKDRLIGKRKRMGGQKPVARMENGGVLSNTGTATPLDLAAVSAEATPPGVRDALAGRRPSNYQFAAPALSLRRFSQLTPGETEALSTNLAVNKNASLGDEFSQLERLFGNVVSAPRSRMNSGGGRFG